MDVCGYLKRDYSDSYLNQKVDDDWYMGPHTHEGNYWNGKQFYDTKYYQEDLDTIFQDDTDQNQKGTYVGIIFYDGYRWNGTYEDDDTFTFVLKNGQELEISASKVDTNGDGKISWLELGDYAAYLNDLMMFVWEDVFEGNVSCSQQEFFDFLEFRLNYEGEGSYKE